MKAMTASLLCALALALGACGQGDLTAPEAEESSLEAAAACTAYLLDQPNFTGPLPPFPLVANPGICINLPAASNNRTSSFRLAGCKVRFFDYPNCQGVSYGAVTSGVMPAWFDNRATSLMFF